MKRTDQMLDARQVLSVVEQYTVALDMLDGNKIIEDYTLVAITIMIAELKPEEKETMEGVDIDTMKVPE